MALTLTNFRIESLYGYRSINIPIEDNRLILVGENGSGKTTIVSLIYYFLSRQWERLSAYDFKSVSATVNGEEMRVIREELQVGVTTGARSRGVDRETYWTFSKYFWTHHDLEVAVREASGDPKRLPLQLALKYLDTQPRIAEELQDLTSKLDQAVTGQVLYLPTYRRIEQDLKTIFPGLDVEKFLYRDQSRVAQTAESYVELVEFGMEDVERRIDSSLTTLKDRIRRSLNEMTGSYLREVLSGKYKTIDVDRIQRVQGETTNAS